MKGCGSMIVVTYKDKSTKIYQTLKDLIKEENIKSSVKRISLMIRNQDYYGDISKRIDDTNILKIKWVNRFGEEYEYDHRKTVPKEYWHIVDFSK